MGYGSYDPNRASARIAYQQASGIDPFAYSQAMTAAAPGQRSAHPDLDPTKFRVRESCDSADHPDSRAVAVLFDETGSMGE